MVELSHRRFYRYGNESGDSDISICSSVRSDIHICSSIRIGSGGSEECQKEIVCEACHCVPLVGDLLHFEEPTIVSV
jgi:hypothetical protein